MPYLPQLPLLDWAREYWQVPQYHLCYYSWYPNRERRYICQLQHRPLSTTSNDAPRVYCLFDRLPSYTYNILFPFSVLPFIPTTPFHHTELPSSARASKGRSVVHAPLDKIVLI